MVRDRKSCLGLTGPYQTRRATIGRLEPPLRRGRFVCDPPTSANRQSPIAACNSQQYGPGFMRMMTPGDTLPPPRPTPLEPPFSVLGKSGGRTLSLGGFFGGERYRPGSSRIPARATRGSRDGARRRTPAGPGHNSVQHSNNLTGDPQQLLRIQLSIQQGQRSVPASTSALRVWRGWRGLGGVVNTAHTCGDRVRTTDVHANEAVGHPGT